MPGISKREENFLHGRLRNIFHVQLRFIRRHFRQDAPGDGPAGPGAPGSQQFAGFDHAGGEVLVVAAGVADEIFRGVVLQDPGYGRVGEGPGGEDGMAGRDIGSEGSVDEQQGLGGGAMLPVALRVVEGLEIKFRSAVEFPEASEAGCRERFGLGRKQGAGRQGTDHGWEVMHGREGLAMVVRIIPERQNCLHGGEPAP